MQGQAEDVLQNNAKTILVPISRAELESRKHEMEIDQASLAEEELLEMYELVAEDGTLIAIKQECTIEAFLQDYIENLVCRPTDAMIADMIIPFKENSTDKKAYIENAWKCIMEIAFTLARNAIFAECFLGDDDTYQEFEDAFDLVTEKLKPAIVNQLERMWDVMDMVLFDWNWEAENVNDSGNS